MSSEAMVLVGAIAGAFGVRGEVRLRPFTAHPEDILAYGPLCDADGRVILTVQDARQIPEGIAVIAAEVKTREDAMRLRNTKLYVPRDAFPETDEDEFYHVDLIGMAVEALDGAALGHVRAVVPGPQDLLDIDGALGRWYLPFTKEMAPVVDMTARRIVADPPDGLVPEAKAPDAPGETA
jgi:16S rRNA processing protein RimM